jgi:translocation and assembly module TamA
MQPATFIFQRFAVVAATFLMLAGVCHAQTASNNNSQGTTAFDIAVRTPPGFPDLRELIEKHNELERYRAVTDLDESELARLVVLAETNIRRLAGTLGYFSPTVEITQDNDGLQRPLIAITITPGPKTSIASTSFSFAGDIATSQDKEAETQKNEIQSGWLLPKGQPFTQDAWDSAKTQALRGLVARRYPAGKIGNSLADIDPASSTADLSVSLDSGPLYRLGPLQITGVSRYNPVLVPRLAQLKEGTVYDQKELIEAQQRIGTSGYFDSATVLIDVDGDPAAVPVQVQVREAMLQKLVLGIGASTDSGPRISLEHSHNRAAGTDWRAVSKVQLEKKSPSFQTEWTSLPDARNWRWSGLARASRFDDNNLITTDQRLRFGRSQQGERIDRNVYVQYDRSNVTVSGNRVTGSDANTANALIGDGSAISASYVWTGRYFDSLPLPRSGFGIGFELGGGFTLSTADGARRQPFVRGVGRWLGLYPLNTSRIAMRAEAGAVLAKESARVPSSTLFRTGGDTTVRGYGLRDIGIQLPGGIIGPGRYVAVGSVEWQRPIRSKGLPTDWENTVFIDAGGVADKPQALRPSVGIGTGVRFKSPIGPLQIDLAYGVKVKRFRLHTSVGFVF